MPWTETDPMTERHKFILAREEGLFSMTELREVFAAHPAVRAAVRLWLGRGRFAEFL